MRESLTTSISVDAGATEKSKGAPAVVINDAVLRQHFRKLTQKFLRPFDVYFGVDAGSVGGSSSFVRGGGFGPYGDPAKLLPNFDEAGFLRRIEQHGIVDSMKYNRSMTKKRWVLMYRRFIRSPHFRPWFNSKRAAHINELSLLMRELRIHTPSRELVRAAAPTLYRMVTDGHNGRAPVPKREVDELIYLHTRISYELLREEDVAHLNKMRGHLRAVTSMIPFEYRKLLPNSKFRSTTSSTGAARVRRPSHGRGGDREQEKSGGTKLKTKPPALQISPTSDANLQKIDPSPSSLAESFKKSQLGPVISPRTADARQKAARSFNA